jgi:mannose-1-phosphate guanylyltransferase
MGERVKVASVDSKQRVNHPALYLTDINGLEVRLEKRREDHYRVAKKSMPYSELFRIQKKPNLCGIVLAGGEGKRLQPLIHRLRGDILPKQFVNFVGDGSVLEHTFLRAEKLIPSDRIFTVANWAHLKCPEVRRQISSRPRGSVVVQPDNKDTGPGLLLPLMSHVYLAYRAVERDPSRLVLLGIELDTPEPEYGYILPGEKLKTMVCLGAFTISRFIEKPARHGTRADP